MAAAFVYRASLLARDTALVAYCGSRREKPKFSSILLEVPSPGEDPNGIGNPRLFPIKLAGIDSQAVSSLPNLDASGRQADRVPALLGLVRSH